MAPTSESTPPGSGSGRSARLGQRVGPFQLVERLGLRDDIGLYRATRPAGSRSPHTVAIRIAEDVRDDRAAAWVRHEYDILRRLDDPRIPKAFGYYSSQVGVATSLPPELTLSDVLDARREGRVPLDVPTAVDIVVELAEALRHAHAITGPDGPICHGHLSPESVGLAADGQVVLLGLGAPPQEVPLGYRPPEQVAGAFVDSRSDQWRLGALIVELILGSALYDGLDDPDSAAGIGQVGPWLSRMERRQPALARISSKLLAQAAGNRYGTENELIRDLLESARVIGGRPDRRALASRVLSVREAEARRHAEAATTIEDARPPELERVPAPPVQPPQPRVIPREVVVAEDSIPDPASVSELPHAPGVPDVERAQAEPAEVELAEVDEPDPTMVPVEIDEDDPSLGLGRVAVADHEEDGPSLGSNLPGLPHTADPFEDPLELPVDGPVLTHAAIAAPIGEPELETTDPVAPEAEATEVVDRKPRPTPAGPRPNKWFPSELGAMAAVGIAALMAVAFLAWRFG